MKITGQILSCSMILLLAVAANAAPTLLEVDDCQKCHEKIVTDVSARGAKHNSEINCLDCHVEHPPTGTNAIPQCSMCHDPGEKAHYQVDGCLDCHNPHHPLDIDFSNISPVKPICISCHAGEGTQLTDYPSKHSELDCKGCHLQHGQFLNCLECHDPHTAEMTYQDCLTCHKPHMPTVVKYPETIPSSFCSGCHDAEAGLLAGTSTLHKDLSCAYCHKGQHKVIPECTTCHGIPHASILHEKFPNCLKCHIDAHGLEK